MRSFLASLLAVLSLPSLLASGARAQTRDQTCTGLCLQQVSCPAGTTTSISGTVYAPNGTDPLPNILVYIPNAPVDAFTPGVSCPAVGQPPSGSPLVGTTTAFDGTFTINNVPVGTSIPLVIQTGRWRRQVVIPTVASCTNTAFSTRFPQNQSEGDIPKFAVATGYADAVECALRKVGIADSEFTNPSGPGRINIYTGSGHAGALVDNSTPSENDLMSSSATLNGYDVLMLPCEGGQFLRSSDQLANIVGFANAGGRVYSSHFSYVWMYNNPPFNTVANWDVGQRALPNGIATVDQTFDEGKTLAQWLQLVGASTTPGQIPIQTLKHDLNGVRPPTQSWLTLNDTADGNPVMQFVFDAPVAQVGGQCGRVLFNEYHVENPGAAPSGLAFPTECSQGAMTAQEKLLEFSLFELTSDGAAAVLTPATQDFGTEGVGFTSAQQTFTWKNNSTFAATVSLLTASGDFALTGNNCSSVAAGGSCQINVVFTPTAIGARTGTLTVGSAGTTLTSSLTGNGVPDLSFSVASLAYGSHDVGSVSTQSFVVTNAASGAVPVPAFITTGDYSVGSTCGPALGAGQSCTVSVSFKPTTTGPRPGTLTIATTGNAAAYPAIPTLLTGNGVDFTFALSPTSGSTIAGYGVQTGSTMTPLAGFNAALSLTCSTTTPATTCTLAQGNYQSGVATADLVTITTGAKYAVIGYGGTSGGWLGLLALLSGAFLWTRRRTTGNLLRATLILLLMAAAGMSVTGCSGKLPAQNSTYTAPGTYTFTVTATDGFLVHSATYALTVTAK